MPNLLIDTHTHFDEPIFEADWQTQAKQARAVGVKHVVLVGYVASKFEQLAIRQTQLNHYLPHAFDASGLIEQTAQVADMLDTTDTTDTTDMLKAHVAYGLHPAYIHEHCKADLDTLANTLNTNHAIAVGEIGLDTFTQALKQPDCVSKQTEFFVRQLDLAVLHELPVLLHIRKAHAQALQLLKQHPYEAHVLGGIAHSFSGGMQEADAFVTLGFKLGVTGQITNPNAKKLRRAITAVVEKHGLGCLVLETDCPDMTPVPCQTKNDTPDRNVPANLPVVLAGLSDLLQVSQTELASILWQNSTHALRCDFSD